MTTTTRATLVRLAASSAILAALLAGGLLLMVAAASGAQEAVGAREAAYRQALDVARATDRGDEPPVVLSCADALDRPSEAACEAYDDALADFIEDAREPCDEGYSRAEDLSCVPPGFWSGKEDDA